MVEPSSKARHKSLHKVLANRIAQSYRASLISTVTFTQYRGIKAFSKAPETRLDKDLSRLISLLERKEETMFLHHSVDMSESISRKVHNIAMTLPKTADPRKRKLSQYKRGSRIDIDYLNSPRTKVYCGYSASASPYAVEVRIPSRPRGKISSARPKS